MHWKGLGLLAMAAMLVAGAGCGGEAEDVSVAEYPLGRSAHPKQREAWQAAMEADSADAYRSFAAKYPRSPYAPLAAQQVDALEWREAAEADTLEAYVLYVAAYPEGSHAETARKIIRHRLQQAQAQWLEPDSGLTPPASAAKQAYSETIKVSDLPSGGRLRYKETMVHFDGHWYRLVSDAR